MSDHSSWSLSFGRVNRVHVRVHALLVAVAIGAVYLCTVDGGMEAPVHALLGVLVLVASVSVHELGHLVAATRAGSSGDQIVLGPFGGLLPLEVPRERGAELMAASGGILANLAVLLVTLPILLASDLNVVGLLSPLEPLELTDGSWWEVGLRQTFWFNWLLIGINLLPAYPFDGARLLRALLWPAIDHRGAAQIAIRTSKLTALAICILAWFVGETKCAGVMPLWVPLGLLATFIFFSALQESARMDEADWDEGLFNYDFSQGYTSLERGSDTPRPRGTLRRWLQNRREIRRRRRLSQEQDEERQVDEILLRLHETGMDGLSAKERALLNRVSARYRNRQQS